MYISVVTLHVKDLDRAIDFYTKILGWKKTMDAPMGEDRWVTVAPSEDATAFTLDVAPEKIAEFSGYIIEVDDVFKAHQQLTQQGVEFAEPPRIEPWGGWATFKDSEGNVHGMHSAVPAGVTAN